MKNTVRRFSSAEDKLSIVEYDKKTFMIDPDYNRP